MNTTANLTKTTAINDNAQKFFSISPKVKTFKAKKIQKIFSKFFFKKKLKFFFSKLTSEMWSDLSHQVKHNQIWQKMKKSLLPFNLFLYSLRRSKFFFIFCQIFLIVIYCCRFCRIQYNNCCIAVENVFNSKFGYSIPDWYQVDIRLVLNFLIATTDNR